MVKSKGAKRDKNRKAKSMKKKRVAQHIKEANDKRATAIQTGEGLGHRAPLLSAPLGVGRPSASNKRPREPGEPDEVFNGCHVRLLQRQTAQ